MSMIGQYEIRELLGEGGIGQVHVALDTVLDREVAIKSLRPELLSDSNFVERFRAEATSLARLNHPNITTLYSLLPDGRNLYMIMERVRGHTLDAILEKRRGPLGMRESLAIIAQAADGLGYAHSMGVIHRDIKPANLMVAENGLVKIMDFGIARVRGSQRLTRDGSIVGTLAYMAPEQLRGEPGDERSDIYSLGIVLYEMLSGTPPFRAESDYDLMQAQITQRPERLRARVTGLDPRVEAALMQALAKKPDQRFPSMRAFSDALGASTLRLDAPKILHDDTRLIEARDVPLAPAPSARPKKRIAVLAVGALAVVAAAVGGGILYAPHLMPFVSGGQASPPSPAQAAAPAPTKQAASAPKNVTAALAPAKPTTAQATSSTRPAGAPPAATVPAALAPTASAPAATTSAAPTAPSAPATPVALSTPTTSEAPTTPAPSAAPAAPAGPTEPAAGPEATPAPAAPSSPAPTTMADVTAALTHKEYEKAAQLAAPLAEAGNREAQFIMGRLYDTGQGVPADADQAAAWYEKSANQGYPKAQYYYGLMFENGRGVPQNYQEAVAWYRKAAIQGDAVAQNDLGIMYAVGQGVPRDDKQAVIWYQMSADQGYSKAEKNLGDMYFAGHGVPRDDQQALYWYLKAARHGHADAQYLLGYLYEKGRGTQPDDQQAADWYQKAAQGGNADAKRALERIRARLGSNR